MLRSAEVRLPKTISTLLVLAVAGMAATDPAFAQRHGGGYHGGGYRDAHGGAGIGLGLGLGIGLGYLFSAPAYYAPAPYYYSPRIYYYPPPVQPYYYPPLVEQAPQAYIEQGAIQPPPQQASPNEARESWWYYCDESKSYYPYVRDCPAGWQRVSPAPPPAG